MNDKNTIVHPENIADPENPAFTPPVPDAPSVDPEELLIIESTMSWDFRGRLTRNGFLVENFNGSIYVEKDVDAFLEIIRELLLHENRSE